MTNVPPRRSAAPSSPSAVDLLDAIALDHPASDFEKSQARRWLDDLTGGAIEHELTGDRVVAAVHALYQGGWPAFVGPDGPVQCPWWLRYEDGEEQ
jgi:hypothetical protein